MSIGDVYTRALWGSMDLFGVTESIERKIMGAITLQFGAAIFAGVGDALVTGTLKDELTVVVLVLAGIAFVNTVLIVRRDFVRPLRDLEAAATTIAAGDVEAADPPSVDQGDEIGSVVDAFDEMHATLCTVSEQAEALSRQEFDADALDESLPGTFGEALDRMAASLRENTRELERLTDHLESKANAFSDAMAAAAEGDLTVRMDPESESAAMEQIGVAFNDMVDQLESTFRRVRRVADDVAASGTSIDDSTDEMQTTAAEVGDAVDEISRGATQQYDNLEQVSQEMNDLSATIEEIAASASEAADASDRTAELGEDVRIAAQNVEEKMGEIEREAGESIEKIEGLQAEVEQIGEIVEFITDIADETNTLALNASIEAARAGEAGEGFAVVADEVKSLAEETQEATDEISGLIESVQDQTEATAREVGETSEEVAMASEDISDNVDLLEDIAGHADQTNAAVQEISDATDEQAASTEEVVAMVDEVTTISEETAGEADTAAAAAEEQVQSLGAVAEDVGVLADRAADLQAVVDGFEVDGGDATTGPTGESAPGATVTTDGGAAGSGFEFGEHRDGA